MLHVRGVPLTEQVDPRVHDAPLMVIVELVSAEFGIVDTVALMVGVVVEFVTPSVNHEGNPEPIKTLVTVPVALLLPQGNPVAAMVPPEPICAQWPVDPESAPAVTLPEAVTFAAVRFPVRDQFPVTLPPLDQSSTRAMSGTKKPPCEPAIISA